MRREALVALIASAEHTENMKTIEESWESMLNLKNTCVALAYHERDESIAVERRTNFTTGRAVYDCIYDGVK